MIWRHGIKRYRDARHSYMLQLNAGVFIDATKFGGRMRFVNDCCLPNCEVAKWNIRGQERCGIFTVQRVKAGEEVTIDYKYQIADSEVSVAL
jgi:SET domain-containing protein